MTKFLYESGVQDGIINPETYPFSAFKQDEPMFAKIYKEYINLTDKPLAYMAWLIKNNFGIIADSKLSIMTKSINTLKRSRCNIKFVNIVRRGDILLTNGIHSKGLLGLAAIMATDNFVLDMPGYKRTKTKMLNRDTSNNRRIMKQMWFEEHNRYWIHVYRYPNSNVADAAARWAYRNYYNPTEGSIKTIHITYRITLNMLSKNPSYSSKLVLQAYYFGTNATVGQKLRKYQLIFPMELHNFFRKSLKNMGRY